MMYIFKTNYEFKIHHRDNTFSEIELQKAEPRLKKKNVYYFIYIGLYQWNKRKCQRHSEILDLSLVNGVRVNLFLQEEDTSFLCPFPVQW